MVVGVVGVGVVVGVVGVGVVVGVVGVGVVVGVVGVGSAGVLQAAINREAIMHKDKRKYNIFLEWLFLIK